jgi:hypothetical protein
VVAPPTQTKCQRGRGRCTRVETPTVVTGTPVQVEAAQEEVNKFASRIHVTAIALIVVGLVSLVGSIYSGLNARHGAEKWLKKAMMKMESKHDKNATTPEPKPEAEGEEYVSMAEFALVDNLRMISFLAIMISCSIIKLGKTALRASWRLKADFTSKVYRKSYMRIAFIAIVSLVIRHYVKDSIHTVKKQVAIKFPEALNKTETVHKKHHSRKLSELDDEDFEMEEENDVVVDYKQGGRFRQYMKAMRGEVEQTDEDEEEELDNQNVETAQSHFKKEVPAWMKKGMFAQPETSSHGVTFEADTVEDKKAAKKAKKAAKKASKKHGKKDKKNHKKHGKKDKKDHKKKDQHKKKHCCAFFPVCFLALIVGHLYQLRNLKTSLIALEALGANMKGYKKDKKAVAAVVVADEESAPQNIEYSFDEHVDKEEYPVVSQPESAPVYYTINEPSTQMQ